MKRSNLFLTTLLAIFTVTVLNAQSFGVDIPSASESPYVTLAGTEGATAMAGGATFTLTGSGSFATRTRTGVTATPISVLEDFVFITDGASTITVEISGLTANQEYTINSYHFEGFNNAGAQAFPARMSIELQENGIPIAGGAQIIDNDTRVTMGVADQTTTTFTFSAVAGATYSIVSTALVNTLDDPAGGNPPPPKQRNRFNGVLVTETNILSVNDFSEDSVSSDVKVSPNPFSESFSIDFDSKISFTTGAIYNTLGKVVKTFNADSNMDQITLNGSGKLFFLVLYNGPTAVANKKIIRK